MARSWWISRLKITGKNRFSWANLQFIFVVENSNSSTMILSACCLLFLFPFLHLFLSLLSFHYSNLRFSRDMPNLHFLRSTFEPTYARSCSNKDDPVFNRFVNPLRITQPALIFWDDRYIDIRYFILGA